MASTTIVRRHAASARTLRFDDETLGLIHVVAGGLAGARFGGRAALVPEREVYACILYAHV